MGTDNRIRPDLNPIADPRYIAASPMHHRQHPPADRRRPLSGYPFYTPRFWHGMRPATWWRLLRSGRFAVSPSRWPMVFGVSSFVPVNAMLAGVQRVVCRRSLAESRLHGAPVFIIGHWRSGTTMLHELLVRDDRFSSPSTFQCFAPHHFLVSEWFFRRFATWMLPGRRPMDNMAAGWERPQEDEFALMNLGLPSPYRRMAFPRRGAVDLDYLDFAGVDRQDQLRWAATLKRFLQTVSIPAGRPLIVKSPTHTGRVKLLAETFPDAKFIHLTRDPRSLYPSTIRLWKTLDEVQAFQSPRHTDDDAPDDYVVTCLRRMYDAFHRDRDGIADGRLIDVRYEDLVDAPVETLQRIYRELHLADFESVRPIFETWRDEQHAQYQTNSHHLDHAIASHLKDVWSDYFDRYGY